MGTQLTSFSSPVQPSFQVCGPDAGTLLFAISQAIDAYPLEHEHCSGPSRADQWLETPVIRFIYPSDPLDAKQPDENYVEEFAAAKAAGLSCSVFSVEDFEQGTFRPVPKLEDGDRVLYRGWMLGPAEYARLCDSIINKGATPVTSSEDYVRCHYLPNWYEACKELTPSTVFLARSADFASELASLNWPKYFVKDYVKSLTTARGSVADTPSQVAEVVDLIEKYRGKIDGGVCVRRFEELEPDTEERYFIVAGTAFGREGTVPDVVQDIASRVTSPFFTADIVRRRDGVLRLIELGDGQVSDRKQWPASRFVDVLRAVV